MSRLRPWLQRLFSVTVAWPLLSLVVGLNVYGREHLPKTGPFILLANHNSHLDALALMSLFSLAQQTQIRPVAASDYFCRNRLVFWAVTTLLNILPIPRTGITRQNNPLTRMSDALARGESLILFPEGSRGLPEQLGTLQAGVAHLIRQHPEVPVVPVYLRGFGRCLPKGEVVLIPFFCDVHIGPPQSFTGSKPEILAALAQVFESLREKA